MSSPGIITYPLGGITYDAEDAAAYFAGRTSGVYSTDIDFAVSAAADGSTDLTVSAGQAWMHVSRWVGLSVTMREAQTLTLPLADSALPRIDRVVLRYDATSRSTSLQVLQGAPSSEPAGPDISRTEMVYDLCLAEVSRPAGQTSVSAANLTDTRADEALCGVMRDGVTGIPAAQLIRRLQADIEAVESGSFYSKAEIDALLQNLNVCPFEVGDVLHTTSSVSPAARFGGTWEEIAANRVLMGASSSHAAGTTAEAGLPDIAGSVGRYTSQYSRGPDRQQGAFDCSGTTSSMGFGIGSGSHGYGTYLNFHASKSNAIYGASDTVQPAAYYVHIWQRIA